MPIHPQQRRLIVSAALLSIFAALLWYGISEAGRAAAATRRQRGLWWQQCQWQHGPDCRNPQHGYDPIDPGAACLEPGLESRESLSEQQLPGKVPASRSKARLHTEPSPETTLLREDMGRRVTLVKARAIGIALRNYAQEHGGRLPTPGGPLSVEETLAPYLEDHTAFEPAPLYEGDLPSFRCTLGCDLANRPVEAGRTPTQKKRLDEEDKEFGYVLGPGGGRAVIYASGKVFWQEAESAP